MDRQQALYELALRMGDNALVLGQRLSEWCGHGPILEQDIAITNMALDHVGQARSWYQYAAELEGQGRTEDDLAYHRDDREFTNLLLVEQPNEDWAYTIVRAFLFDAFNYFYHEGLTRSTDSHIAAIGAKSLKEVTYHLRYSSEWMIRLGDGTEESHRKMQTALDDLFMYSGEATEDSPLDDFLAQEGIAPALSAVREAYEAKVKDILQQATLQLPEIPYMQTGGRKGLHTEYLGHLLAEMQVMQRNMPGLDW
jgi:ring-1,2-phenylacetyl-CoA epoxidase subunit PaaC